MSLLHTSITVTFTDSSGKHSNTHTEELPPLLTKGNMYHFMLRTRQSCMKTCYRIDGSEMLFLTCLNLNCICQSFRHFHIVRATTQRYNPR